MDNRDMVPSTPIKVEVYERHYTESGFLHTIKNFALNMGYEVVEKALCLFYTLQQKQTPLWAKRVIWGALAYLIVPIDAIFDLIPGIGFTDDLGVIAGAIVTVMAYITPESKALAKAKARQIFKRNA